MRTDIAFRAGHQARLDNQPYNSREHSNWREGWLVADQARSRVQRCTVGICQQNASYDGRCYVHLYDNNGD